MNLHFMNILREYLSLQVKIYDISFSQELKYAIKNKGKTIHKRSRELAISLEQTLGFPWEIYYFSRYFMVHNAEKIITSPLLKEILLVLTEFKEQYMDGVFHTLLKTELVLSEKSEYPFQYRHRLPLYLHYFKNELEIYQLLLESPLLGDTSDYTFYSEQSQSAFFYVDLFYLCAKQHPALFELMTIDQIRSILHATDMYIPDDIPSSFQKKLQEIRYEYFHHIMFEIHEEKHNIHHPQYSQNDIFNKIFEDNYHYLHKDTLMYTPTGIEAHDFTLMKMYNIIANTPIPLINPKIFNTYFFEQKSIQKWLLADPQRLKETYYIFEPLGVHEPLLHLMQLPHQSIEEESLFI